MPEPTNQTPPAAPPTPAPAAKIEYKYGNENVTYDLTKAEDVERLKTRAQVGHFADKTAERVRAEREKFEGERAQFQRDAEIGRSMQEFLRENPERAALVQDIYRGVLDPAQVRQALAAVKSGDVSAVQAQASASGDPEARALLRQISSQMETVTQRVSSFESQQAARDRDAAILSAVTSDPALANRASGRESAARRARELVNSGLSIEVAASQAIQEYKDMLSESATVERDRLAGQAQLKTADPQSGLPPVAKIIKDRVDPKAHPTVQAEQRQSAMLEAFRALKAQAGG
jgi:hypothetical protein